MVDRRKKPQRKPRKKVFPNAPPLAKRERKPPGLRYIGPSGKWIVGARAASKAPKGRPSRRKGQQRI